jgi:hypothetical protein
MIHSESIFFVSIDTYTFDLRRPNDEEHHLDLVRPWRTR